MIRAALLLLAAAICTLVAPHAVAATLDPAIRMHTLETPHFRVNYPAGYHAIAQKAGRYAEEAHDKVSDYFHVAPKQKTELTLFDHEDTVNGLALPYVTNAIYVYLTNPDADFLWGRYDDWLRLVIIHEYTHILHFETVEGLPAKVNDVFGRMLFPNLFQPAFLIEGLAVTTESMFTAGGRAKDGFYDMYLRADVLANRQLTIDQAGGYYLTDFPGGDAPYVYGTYFYRYLIARYGADKPPAIAHAYGRAPWLGVDAAVRSVIPGRDAQAIWDELRTWLRARAGAQLARIRQRPVTETKALTRAGMNHRHPRYLPNGHLVYIEGLRHGLTGLREVVGRGPGGEPVLKALFPKSHYGAFDVARDGSAIVYHGVSSPSNYYGFDDLFRYDMATGAIVPLTDAHTTPRPGLNGESGKLLRVSNPGFTPDGRRIVAVVNDKGTNNLVLLDARGRLIRRLTALDDNTQFTAPRVSPDGRHVVMSAWHAGARDLFMLDLTTNRTHALWHDEWVDTAPTWSPDGRYVVFSSDRSDGVFNLFAYDWAKGTLHQVTNVLTGAIEPAVSPDGRTVAFCMATGKGFDIHTAAFAPEAWLPAPRPGFDAAIVAHPAPGGADYPSHPYSPLPSLFPKFWSPIYLSNPPVAGVFTLGYDVLLTNTLFALAGYSVSGASGTPAGTAIAPLDLAMYQVLYANSQWDTNVNVFAGGYPFGYPVPLADGSTVSLLQRFESASVSLGWNNLPSPLTNASYQTGDTWTLGFNVRGIRDLTPAATNAEAARARLIPTAGRAHSVSAAYRFNSNGRYGYSVSPETGGVGSVGVEAAHPALGSEVEFYRLYADTRRFFKLPLPHHVLATRAMGGLNFGKPQGDFYLGGNRSAYLGGTTDIRAAGEPDDVLVALRGYPIASGFGNTVGLLSGEYRFPIMELQHGPGTLPFFAERLAGSVFLDGGTAFTNNWLGQAPGAALPGLADFRASVGLEARLNFKIANNPLNTPPLSAIARSAIPALRAFDDSSGIFRLGLAQALLATPDGRGGGYLPGPAIYAEFGTFF